jgi:hypothetical protein
MFMQVITGKVTDRDWLLRQDERWQQEIRPGATGYLGSTAGVTADGRFFASIRFETAEQARANSDRPEQGAWWSETEKCVADVEFHDCSRVETLLGGGSDDATFVQVMRGRIEDRAAFDGVAEKMAANEAAMHEARPDVLGEAMAIHDDGEGYTDIIYFTSEADARANEAKPMAPELQALLDEAMTAGPVVEWFDLTDLVLH